jgi:hypothetical protein
MQASTLLFKLFGNKQGGILIYLGIISVSVILFSCAKEELASITTASVTNITCSTAASGGTITDEGSGKVFERGIC